MKKRLTIIPAICVMILIFLYSSQTAIESVELSGGITGRLVEVILNISKIELSPVDRLMWLEKMETVIRKAAHMVEYAILGIAVSYPLYVYGKRGKKLMLWGVLICVLYAITDELHQLYVPGRAGQVGDVVIDGIGGLVGCLVFFRVIRVSDRISP